MPRDRLHRRRAVHEPRRAGHDRGRAGGFKQSGVGRELGPHALDHYTEARHEAVRGPNSWAPAMAGLRMLARHAAPLAIAGRTLWDEPDAALRAGYRALFAELGLAVDADDPAALVLFPEMDARADVPEITERCWGILGKSPADMMCASSRMVVKRRGADLPAVKDRRSGPSFVS